MVDIDQDKKFVPFPPDRADFYRKSGCWIGQNHTDFLRISSEKYTKKTAIIQDNKILTYGELYEKVIQYGSYLKKQGINKGDFIIVQSPNVIEYFIVLFALYYIGARPVFCLDGHGAYEIENIAKVSETIGYIRIIKNSSLQKEDTISIINKFSEANTKVWYQQTIYSDEDHLPSIFIENDDILLMEAEAVDPESIAFLQLSGGTTGMSKLIPRTHDDYLYSVRLSAEIAQLDSSSNQLIALPISHNFTMSSPGFLGAIYSGSTIVLAENGSPDICFPLIEKYKISQVSLVPSLAIIWLNSSALKDYDLDSLKVIQVGGAALPPDIAKKILSQLGVKLQQVYGMAEGLVNFTRLNDDLDTMINTQGKKLSTYDEILIIDDEGKELQNGKIGHIITRGPYTINGYYNADKVNLLSFNAEGFYKTGDIGYLDSTMNIVITGRAKDQINRAGEKIAPSEIENLIIQHPDIKDVSVVGVTDVMLGEKIKAIIIATDDKKNISLLDIRKFLIKKNIALYKLPDEIELVKSFQYTLIGKVKKQKKT